MGRSAALSAKPASLLTSLFGISGVRGSGVNSSLGFSASPTSACLILLRIQLRSLVSVRWVGL